MDVSDVLGVLVEEVLRGILLPVGVREVGRTVRYKRLRKSFLRKYPDKLLYVKADSRGRGENEYFHYNEAYLLSGFSFERFTDLLSTEDILTDIRIGQHSNGRPHDHGTGFRIKPDKLDMCFENRARVL